MARVDRVYGSNRMMPSSTSNAVCSRLCSIDAARAWSRSNASIGQQSHPRAITPVACPTTMLTRTSRGT
jgi:hypothetical protein